MLNTPVMALSTGWIVFIAITVVLLIALVALYILGRKAEKRQESGQKQIEANAQLVDLLIIDKKKLKIKDAGLPSIVMENTPWYAKRAKVPIVKAKVQARVMNFMADAKIYDQLLPNQRGTAKISGIYITSFRRKFGPIAQQEEPKKGLKKLFSRKK